MAAVLHGSARTTPCVRAELQTLKESTRALAALYGLNPKMVAKWRGRETTVDAAMGTARSARHRALAGRAGDDRRVSTMHPAAAR